MSKATSSLGLATGWAVLLVTGSIATAGSAVPGRTVTIGVSNYAKVSSRALAKAKNEARAVLQEAGIETMWVDCPLAGRRVDPGPCEASTDFFLTILASAMTGFPASERDALGFALPCHGLGAGCMAYVFYARIEALAAYGDATPSVILGYAMAHEIGHLLLGPGHSPFGIMRAEWNRGDLQLASRQQLGFVPAQAKSLRAAVSTGNLEVQR
jgi:hypothetical protein